LNAKAGIPPFYAKRVVDELTAVALETSPRADLVGDALRRLEDSMEVVPLHEPGTAESEYVGMHVALPKLRFQCVRPLLRLGKRGRRRCRIELAVLTQFETDEAQRQVEPFAVCLEALRLAAEPFRRHRHLDEAADGVGVAVLVLSRCERFV